jgi:Protein of unknown function (DUF2934)
MQLNKASKKTRNIAEETIASAPEISAAAEGTPKPRATRSSKTKKTETTEAGPVNHHHKASSLSTEKPKSAPITSSIIDPVGVVTPPVETELLNTTGTASASDDISHEEVSKLAYSYWIARGYTHGGAEQDWLRAEQELKAKR